jgi:hypothetical protein
MSEIKVNKISPRAACGTVQLGDSGDTFTIPAGATINNQGTATNFGATGSASWVTTVKTSTFTAVAGEGYFVNTTGGAVTVNLPAGTAGAVVAIKDYAGTFDTNAVTLSPNGSDKIGGDGTTDATLTTEGIAVTLVFIDSTQGWLVTDSGLQSEAPTATFISATGGTVTIDGNFKVHSFTGPGTFTVCSVGNAAGSNTVDYMVVAGGGSGGSCVSATSGGGGGAGGYRESPGTTTCYTASPLGASPAVALPVTATGFPIVVGGGATAVPTSGTCKNSNGSPSSFSTITSAGGGGGGANPSSVPNPTRQAAAGGSGGGAPYYGPATGGAGNTPPTNPAQGQAGGNGGSSPAYGSGGGGGASAAGANGTSSEGGDGGDGTTSNITGSSVTRAGGGGGAAWQDGPPTSAGAGGTGGGGAGGADGGNPGTAGTTNTGGGGGGASGTPQAHLGGNGGSGIVIIRYKFQ